MVSECCGDLFIIRNSPPIEFVWTTGKGEWARLFSHKTRFQEQRIRLEDAFTIKIDSAYCSEAFKYVRQFEKQYWKVDLELDDELNDENELYGTKFDDIL